MSLASIQNSITNPFSTRVETSIKGQDFPEGFLIEEILPSGAIYKKINLLGNMMPMVPFTFGGSQRVKKDYYSGDSEPSVQVLGSEEANTVLKGKLKDKKLPFYDQAGTSTEVQQFIDAIRLRGNLCRFVLGEWQRYGYIESTKFEMKNLGEVEYELTLSLIGFNAPKNAKFMEQRRTVPFKINEDLVSEMQDFALLTPIPDTVPRSIGDKLNEVTGAVAGAVSLVTDFIDTAFAAIQDVQKAVERGKGLVKHAISKFEDYKATVGAFDPFDTESALTGQYQNASFYQNRIVAAAGITATLLALRNQLSSMSSNIPQARHLVTESDTLQSISIKYFGVADNWKDIYDYNDLTSSDLTGITVLDIPRL